MKNKHTVLILNNHTEKKKTVSNLTITYKDHKINHQINMFYLVCLRCQIRYKKHWFYGELHAGSSGHCYGCR